MNKSDDGVNVYETHIGGNKVFARGNFRVEVAMDLHKFDLDHTYTDEVEVGMHFTETYIVRPQVSLSYLLKKNWSFTAFVQSEAASDFQGDWTDEGFNVGYGAYFTKTWKHSRGAMSSLVMGLEYSTAFGKLRVIPVLNYRKKINEHWNYAAGYPYTYLAYAINRHHTIKPLLDLDSFYAGVNVVTGYFDEKENLLYKLNYLNINGRVDYEYYFNQGWNLVAGLGYSIYNELNLYREDREIYAYDTASSPYVSLGVKYNF